MKTLMVTGEITAHSADAFIREVEAAGSTYLRIVVDSVGGQVDGALRMGAALQRHTGHSEALLCRADSAALYLVLGCDHAVAARDATAKVHDPVISVPSATGNELRQAADYLDGMQRGLAGLLEQRTLENASFWQYLARKDTVLDAEDMVAYGLVDEISPLPKAHLLRRR